MSLKGDPSCLGAITAFGDSVQRRSTLINPEMADVASKVFHTNNLCIIIPCSLVRQTFWRHFACALSSILLIFQRLIYNKPGLETGKGRRHSWGIYLGSLCKPRRTNVTTGKHDSSINEDSQNGDS